MSGRYSPDPLDSPPPADHSPDHIVGWDVSPRHSYEDPESSHQDNELPEVALGVREARNLVTIPNVLEIVDNGTHTPPLFDENAFLYNQSDHANLQEVDTDNTVNVVDVESNDSVATVNYDAENSLETASHSNQSYIYNRTSTVTSQSTRHNTNDLEIVNQNVDEGANLEQPQSVQSISDEHESNLSAATSDSNSNFAARFRTDTVLEPLTRKGEPLSEEPPAKLRKVASPKSPGSDNEGDSCPICLEPWGNSGDHRLVSLKCGHLFGYKCVERWFKSQRSKRSCPTCKSKSHPREIRFIFARKLVTADLSEITNLQKEVEKLKAEKNRVELELQKTNIAHRSTLHQLEALRSSLVNRPPDRNIRKGWRFALEKNLEVCKDGGCRVMTYNCRTYELYVSQKSTNNLFPGYGVRRVSCVDYKLNQFIHLHPKSIRDISYSQPKDLLLSVSLDTTARIVERGIPSALIQTSTPLWSCAWDVLNENHLFTGGVGGTICEYDIRNAATPLNTFISPSDLSPIISLCSTEFGLLSCSLNSSHLWVPSTSNWEPKFLPIEGPYMSMAYDMESHRALVSCRPSNNEKSRLVVCKLRSDMSETVCNVEQVVTGSAKSTLMSRATFVKVPGASWLAAHSESDSSLFLHGMDGSRTMSLPASEPALDVCCVNLNGDTILTALSESRLRIYKAVPTNL